MGWIASFLYSQLFVTLPKPTKDFSGQTIIVTGSNTGLGLEAARHISRLNAALIVLAVRNRDKGEAAKQSILSSTGRTDATIEVWILDMQSYDSIQAFCAKVNQLRRLDAVLENAGIMTNHFNMVAGYESTITTNVIGTFLLALGVLPKLRQSAAEYNMQPRLSIVSSDLHSVAQFPERHSTNIFAALNDEDSEMAMPRYATSKLIQVFGVRELAIRATHGTTWQAPTVIINCLTPGACLSDFDRESTGFARFKWNVMAALLARTTEAGSRTLVNAVSAGEESHGSYLNDCRITEPGPLVVGSEGMALQKKVWDQLVTQLETIQPRISQNI